MKVVVLILVIVSAFFAIAGGVWVAIALVRAVSANRGAYSGHVTRDPSDEYRTGRSTSKSDY